MLSTFDDYPIHQTSRPVAHPLTGDLNHYDRYFFNGYSRAQDGPDALYFAAAMGLYPNRHVADAAFSVVLGGGQQINVHASRRAPDDRRLANLVVPIEVIVEEPLARLRLLVDAPEHGLRADITFVARSQPIEEPHFHHLVGVRVVLDFTRLTQFGTWEGWIEIDGRRIEVTAATTWGSRDRSWGVRPVGEQGATGAPVRAPQFYWLWAPVNFDAYSTHFDVNELADGRRWHETGVIAGVPGAAGGGAPAIILAADYRLTWRPGTRRVATFELSLTDGDGGVRTVVLEPLYDFQMLGIGYGHPEWGHGVWKGEHAVGGDRWELPVGDPCAPHHLHVQSVCRARCGDDVGVGILEQLVVGEHHPSGLTGILDGYSP